MKMAAEVRWLNYAALFFIATYEVFGNVPLRRFEYKYSFKPPYLAQRDGSVPFWEYGGSKFDIVTWFHISHACQMADTLP
jgi:mannose-binding lectin 1